MPREYSTSELLQESAQLERRAFDLLCDVSAEVVRNVANVTSVEFCRDQDLQRFRDRTENDLHAFFEVGGTIYHLRAYLCHMLARRRAEGEDPQRDFQNIELTGYRKPRVALHGGTHSLRQDRYPWDPAQIARAVIEQNADLFLQRQTMRPPAEAEGTGHTAE